MTDEAKALAVIVWTTSRADEGTISGIGADHVAAAILASEWLAQRDARVRAEALREAADASDQKVLGSPFSLASLGPWLRERADRIEAESRG